MSFTAICLGLMVAAILFFAGTSGMSLPVAAAICVAVVIAAYVLKLILFLANVCINGCGVLREE